MCKKRRKKVENKVVMLMESYFSKWHKKKGVQTTSNVGGEAFFSQTLSNKKERFFPFEPSTKKEKA